MILPEAAECGQHAVHFRVVFCDPARVTLAICSLNLGGSPTTAPQICQQDFIGRVDEI
jgi:hypothetical protein